jgi:hypothetical protein
MRHGLRRWEELAFLFDVLAITAWQLSGTIGFLAVDAFD